MFSEDDACTLMSGQDRPVGTSIKERIHPSVRCTSKAFPSALTIPPSTDFPWYHSFHHLHCVYRRYLRR